MNKQIMTEQYEIEIKEQTQMRSACERSKSVMLDLSAKSLLENIRTFWLESWVVISIFIFCVAFINPFGNFPICDDWGYGEPIFHYLRTGNFEMHGNCAASLPHFALGIMCCKLFGSTYDTIRIISLLEGLICVLTVSSILKACGLEIKLRNFFSLLVLLNPIFLYLCFGYQTDISALMFTLFYMRSLISCAQNFSYKTLGLACLNIAIAASIRQTAIVMAGLGIILYLRSFANWKRAFAISVLIFIVPFITMQISDNYSMAYQHLKLWPLYYKEQLHNLFVSMLHHPLSYVFPVAKNLSQLALYCGWLLLPALLLFPRLFVDMFQTKNRIKAYEYVLATVFTSISAWFLLHNKATMPVVTGILHADAIGEWTFSAASSLSRFSYLNIVHTITSFIGSYFFIVAILYLLRIALFKTFCQQKYLSKLKNLSGQKLFHMNRWAFVKIMPALAMLLSAGATLCLMLIYRDFDRYYLSIFIYATIFMAVSARYLGNNNLFRTNKLTLLCAYLVLSGLALYSILGVRDFMELGRHKLRLTTKLEKTGVMPKNIDAGYDYNLAHNMLLAHCLEHTKHDGMQYYNRGAYPRNAWRWWPVDGEKYILSAGPVDGYVSVDKEFFRSFLTGRKWQVDILKMNENNN